MKRRIRKGSIADRVLAVREFVKEATDGMSVGEMIGEFLGALSLFALLYASLLFIPLLQV